MHEKILKENIKANREMFISSEPLKRDEFLYERYIELRLELEILRQRIKVYEEKGKNNEDR